MNHTGVRSTASRRSAASMRSRPVMAVAVPLTAASVDPDVEGRCLVAAAIGADREVGVGADDPGKAGDALGHQSGKGIEVGDADHRDEVRRSRRGVDLRDAVDVGQGSAQAADRPRLADDEKEGGEHPAMVLTHPATPARRPTAASRDVGVTTRDGGRRREHDASQMDEQLVCINCWKWYDGRTVCPTCKTPLVHPGTGQAPADSVPPAASAQPAAGPAWPGAPAPLPAESGYGGPPLPVSGYPTRLETRDYLAGNPSGAPTPLLQERLASAPPAPPAWEPAPLPPPDVEPTPPARPEPEAAPTVPTWGLRQRREEAPTPPDVASPETVSPSPAPYPPSTPAPVPPPTPAPAPAPPPVPADTASTADDGYSAPPAQDRYPAAPLPDRYSAAPAEGRYAAPASAPDQHSAAPAEDWDSAVPAEDDSFAAPRPDQYPAPPPPGDYHSAPPAPPPEAWSPVAPPMAAPASAGPLAARLAAAAPSAALEAPESAIVPRLAAVFPGPGAPWEVSPPAFGSGPLPGGVARPSMAGAAAIPWPVGSPPSGGLLIAAGAGLAAGLVAATLWVAAAALTGLALAPVAVVVGVAVGLVVRRVARARGGASVVTAAVVSLMAVGLGLLFAGLAAYSHAVGASFAAAVVLVDRSFLPHLWTETGMLGAALAVAGVVVAGMLTLPVGRTASPLPGGAGDGVGWPGIRP